MDPIAPPTEPVEVFDNVDQSSWPRVLGIIGLIYAVVGLLCAMAYAGSTLASESLMRMAGMEVETPTVIVVAAAVQSILLLGVGIVLLVGAINLLRRRRSGPGAIKVWVVLRLLVLLGSVVVMFFTMPANIQMQQDIADAQRDMLVKQGGDASRIPVKTDAALQQQLTLTGIGFSLAFAAFPVFMGIWFSRRSIADQVRAWD